jgi:hypothetical protein
MNDDDARPTIDDDPAHSRPPKHVPSTFAQKAGKVGRNDPCPCKSGRKLKHCCVYPSGSGG